MRYVIMLVVVLILLSGCISDCEDGVVMLVDDEEVCYDSMEEVQEYCDYLTEIEEGSYYYTAEVAGISGYVFCEKIMEITDAGELCTSSEDCEDQCNLYHYCYNGDEISWDGSDCTEIVRSYGGYDEDIMLEIEDQFEETGILNGVCGVSTTFGCHYYYGEDYSLVDICVD